LALLWAKSSSAILRVTAKRYLPDAAAVVRACDDHIGTPFTPLLNHKIGHAFRITLSQRSGNLFLDLISYPLYGLNHFSGQYYVALEASHN
jgi:hypothetical protein